MLLGPRVLCLGMCSILLSLFVLVDRREASTNSLWLCIRHLGSCSPEKKSKEALKEIGFDGIQDLCIVTDFQAFYRPVPALR